MFGALAGTLVVLSNLPYLVAGIAAVTVVTTVGDAIVNKDKNCNPNWKKNRAEFFSKH